MQCMKKNLKKNLKRRRKIVEGVRRKEKFWKFNTIGMTIVPPPSSRYFHVVNHQDRDGCIQVVMTPIPLDHFLTTMVASEAVTI